MNVAASKVLHREPAKAAKDLSEKQFFLVKYEESTEIDLAASGDQPFILMTNPKEGQTGTYACAGIEKAVCGAAVKAGDLVASSNAGELQKAVSGQFIVGMALESGEANQLVSVLIASVGTKA